MKTKTELILFMVVILCFIGQNIYFNHRLNKVGDVLEEEITILKDSMNIVIKRQDDIVLKQGKSNTQKAKDNKKSIEDKLKEDEKTIDTTTISDSDIRDFLSNYNQR